MRKKWVISALALSLLVCLLVPAGQIQAADASVKVTLPTFKVSLNGHTVENQYRQYPLLVYRGITYFPMTWNDTRLLGLEVAWSPAAGLDIKQSKVTSSYAPYKAGSRNAATYSAKISTSAITVNGKVINNSKEQYPLLSFWNVTYFPLTWRFAHEEFGWDYKWNAASGLSITSRNPQLQTAGLPTYAAKNDIALFKGYYYFVETRDMTNHVYRVPVQKPSKKEEIYSYSFQDLEFGQVMVIFQIRDDTLWFTYHRGGGVTGSDAFVKINANGKAGLILDGYLDFRDTPYGTLIVRFNASAFEGGNMYLSPPGQENTVRKSVGDPKLMYTVSLNGSSWSLRPDDPATYFDVIGEDVYVFASRDKFDANNIYKVNLKTNKTEKIVGSKVIRFRIIGNKLYYIKDEDKALYSSALDGTGEMKLSEDSVSWFDSIEGNLFYTTDINELHMVNSNGIDPLVWTSPVASVQVLNDKLVCQLGGTDGVVILDGSGRLMLKVADPIKRVLTSDHEVLLQNANSAFELIR